MFLLLLLDNHEKPESDFKLFLSEDEEIRKRAETVTQSQENNKPSVLADVSSKSDSSVAKVGRRVNLITLSSASELGKS